MAGGAPKGNTNARKGRRWSQAIDKALKQYTDDEIKAGHAMDAIARRLVKHAIQGDSNEFKDAIKEIGDRIEGKAVAAVEITEGRALEDASTEELQAMLNDLRNGS